MKNILITGGGGYIGTNLTQKLLEKNYNVTVIDGNNCSYSEIVIVTEPLFSIGAKEKLSSIFSFIK